MSKDYPEELRGELVTNLQEVQRQIAEKEREKRAEPEKESTEQDEPDVTERESQLVIDEGQQSHAVANIRVGGSIQYNLPTIFMAEEEDELQVWESTKQSTETAQPKPESGGLSRARRIDPTVEDLKECQQRALAAVIDKAMELGHFEEAEKMRAKHVPETPSVFSDVMAANLEQEKREQEERERESTLAVMEMTEETAERHRKETELREQQEREQQ